VIKSIFKKCSIVMTALALALTVVPAGAALGQGNSPGNRKCPQGQVPQGNSGYCVPNPGQSKSKSKSKKKKKKSKKSLGHGKFKNTDSDNPRNGKTFTVKHRNGHTYHVYPGPPEESVQVD
jgi:hypothetical protein